MANAALMSQHSTPSTTPAMLHSPAIPAQSQPIASPHHSQPQQPQPQPQIQAPQQQIYQAQQQQQQQPQMQPQMHHIPALAQQQQPQQPENQAGMWTFYPIKYILVAYLNYLAWLPKNKLHKLAQNLHFFHLGKKETSCSLLLFLFKILIRALKLFYFFVKISRLTTNKNILITSFLFVILKK